MTPNDVRELIVSTLARTGVTQSDLAARLGVTPATVSIMLRRGNPTMKTLARIGEALGLKLVVEMPPRATRVPIANYRWIMINGFDLARIALDHVWPLDSKHL